MSENGRKKKRDAGENHAAAGDLMGVVRECFYVPDGKPPEDYNAGRDMSILKYWLKKGGNPERIEAAIRGVALMRDREETYFQPGEKLTLRCLNPKEARYGRHLFQAGADYWELHVRERARRNGKPLGMDAAPDVLRRLGETLIQQSRTP